jgi:DNA polymerase-3 subunit alpha
MEALRRRLEPAQGQKGGEVTFVAAIGGGREIELRLPGRYTLDAALRGALKTAPGVALLEDV